jgi:hypothetical protein
MMRDSTFTKSLIFTCFSKYGVSTFGETGHVSEIMVAVWGAVRLCGLRTSASTSAAATGVKLGARSWIRTNKSGFGDRRFKAFANR